MRHARLQRVTAAEKDSPLRRRSAIAASRLAGKARQHPVAALQQKVGNRVVSRMIQRHPSHAEEEQVQRHPSHAEEEDVQRKTESGYVQRESKKKRKARMEPEYGINLTGELPESMLKKIDSILKLLPRSHTKGNDALKAIHGGGGIGGNASAYDYGQERIEMNTPEITDGVTMPTWLYLLLSKGVKWQREMMDAGAMGDFDIKPDEDAELGLDAKGKRQVMAGVSDVLAKGNLVSWTLRHETGHAVDQKIKFTEKRGKMPQFGGWRTYANDKPDEMKELAGAFLEKAGFAPDKIDIKLTTATKQSLREMLGERIGNDQGPITQGWTSTFAKALGMPDADVKKRLEELNKVMRIAMAHPWTFSDGGGDLIKLGDRMYHRDHYDTWVSYLASARDNALSNYQFSSPGEWFAEAYAAVYDGSKKSAARNRLDPAVRSWFIQNLGPPSFSSGDAKQSKGKLEDKNGHLQTLADLDDAVANALADPSKKSTVKLSDLPDDLKDKAKILQGF